MEQQNLKNQTLGIISTINQIEGFSPELFAIEFNDLLTGEKRQHLPVMIQMAWFRLKYPEGKISVNVIQSNDSFSAFARIYKDYRDNENCYLAEATASRAPDPEKPTVSPLEWAQTAAIGNALRNAGFGLQFAVAGEDFASNAFEIDLHKDNVQNNNQSDYAVQSSMKILSKEEKIEQAKKTLCPITQYQGKTLGQVLLLDPNAINWLANKYNGDANVSEAARIICEYAVEEQNN